MRVANNVGWGGQTTQQLTQHLKTMEMLGVLTQHFLSLSNFTQHRKSRCWVTQHGGQTIQHFTQHDVGSNVGWDVGSFDRSFTLISLSWIDIAVVASVVVALSAQLTSKTMACTASTFEPTLKDKSRVDKIIVKKQPYQLLNTNREFFPNFDASNFHKLVNESS